MKPRTLTVYYHRPDRPHQHPRSLPTPMPYLRLRGRWLERAGFAVGTQVQVAVEAGRLVVTPLNHLAQEE